MWRMKLIWYSIQLWGCLASLVMWNTYNMSQREVQETNRTANNSQRQNFLCFIINTPVRQVHISDVCQIYSTPCVLAAILLIAVTFHVLSPSTNFFPLLIFFAKLLSLQVSLRGQGWEQTVTFWDHLKDLHLSINLFKHLNVLQLYP